MVDPILVGNENFSVTKRPFSTANKIKQTAAFIGEVGQKSTKNPGWFGTKGTWSILDWTAAEAYGNCNKAQIFSASSAEFYGFFEWTNDILQVNIWYFFEWIYEIF